MKYLFMLCLLTLSLHYEVTAQSSNNDPVDKLENYFSTYNPERAYLQFDRPYYAAADTIFFKAYVTQGGNHSLSVLSGVLHVDLVNPENRIDQSLKLHLDSGVCWGDFVLPDSIPAGNYRVRAYTRWMLNLGELDFFDQNISVGSISNRNVSNHPATPLPQVPQNKGDIQFFPEGGNLVAGIRTKMAFKAIGPDGLGTDVKGVIVDKDDRQICIFASSHLGMGSFYLYPDKGNAYKAKLTFPDGSQSIVDLPKADSSGIRLSTVDVSTSAISITVMSNAAYYHANKNKRLLLVIYSGEKALTYSFKLDTLVNVLEMAKRALKTGVSTITLFSPVGEPLCERLLFVNNHDLLNLQIHPDKPGYKKREKVSLQLNAKDLEGLPINGHFSVAVVDESKLPMSEDRQRNIETELLLTSDLKGYVEQPNYYFDDTGEIATGNLDLLMLTQGYRNFEWKRVLSDSASIVAFHPEKGIEINGKLTNLSDKPLAHGTVTLIPSGGGTIVTSQSDKSGLFRFSNLVFTDSIHAVLSAVNSKGSNTTKISYLNPNDYSPTVFDLPYTLPAIQDTGMLVYLEITKEEHDTIAYTSGRGKLLKPVTVKGFRQDNHYRTESLAGAGFADQVMHADDIEKIGGQLSTSLNGRLRGVSFIQGMPFLTSSIQNDIDRNRPAPMLVILDGTEIRPGISFSIDDIPAGQVETVEVLKSTGASIYGMDGASGVLVITTKDGSERSRDIPSVGVLPITATGFYKARTFYSPKYDVVNTTLPGADIRSTIYWNPEILTDKDGNAALDYFNADGTGTYKIVIEGIDNNGNIGRLVYRYKVD